MLINNSYQLSKFKNILVKHISGAQSLKPILGNRLPSLRCANSTPTAVTDTIEASCASLRRKHTDGAKTSRNMAAGRCWRHYIFRRVLLIKTRFLYWFGLKDVWVANIHKVGEKITIHLNFYLDLTHFLWLSLETKRCLSGHVQCGCWAKSIET